jgi:putative acyl-CoA dehydrogenase
MNARVQPVAVAEVKASPFATHEVRNQARPATGFNAFEDDRALSGLIAKLAPWARDRPRRRRHDLPMSTNRSS